MNEHLRLLAALAVRILVGVVPSVRIDHVPVDLPQICGIIVPVSEPSQPVTIREHPGPSGRLDPP
jgi:hypothetical protein